MHSGEAKDVFISYRREDGATAARLLCDALERRNISTFFDKETIEGDFHESIRKNLAAAKNVLVVVSARMFSRCQLADGSYDPEAVKGDWVYEELRISLELGKNIIPVFVNGVTGFPPRLPEPIRRIAVFDALKLDHEHFDAEMAKLIGRLETPKSQLLEAYMKLWEEWDPKENLDDLTDICLNLSNDNAGKIAGFLKKTLRASWEQSATPDQEALELLINGIALNDIKKLSRLLELDDTGSSKRIKENILAWLRQDHRSVRKLNQNGEDDTRLSRVIDVLAEHYREVSARQELIDKIEDHFSSPDGHKRSSWHVFKWLFERYDVKDFFEIFEKYLTEADVKSICDNLSLDSTGRKKNLIDRILQFVDYEYPPENTDNPSSED